MPTLNALNTHILYTSANLPDGDTGSSDPAPAGPNVDPQLQQFINSFGQIGQSPKTPASSDPVTVPSVVAHFSPFGEAPAFDPAQVTRGALAAFAGPNSPLPASDADSSDPAPVGPNVDPQLQQFINGLSQIGHQPRKPESSAPVTMPSVVANFSPFGEAPAFDPAQVTRGSLGAFAGPNSPLPPADTDSQDPAPVGPNVDPQLQQLINGLSQLGQSAPNTPEPFRGAQYLSRHRVRLDP